MSAVVLGLGQHAKGDDAVGLWVAQTLRAQGVEAYEAGDASALLTWLAEGRDVIVVDAVVGAAAPGEVHLLRPAALARAGFLPVSSHGLGLLEVLELARCMDAGLRPAERVEIVAIAIERPRQAHVGLSAPVESAVDAACALVRRRLGRP